MNTLPLNGYELHGVAPERLPDLRCRFLKPLDFQVTSLPPEPDIDFGRRSTFLPLAVTLTPDGPLVFSVAAKPAHPVGLVSHSLETLCRSEGFQRGEIVETRVNGLPAVTCDAIQQGAGIVMRMRLVLLEDGGRLFHITAMAPEALWLVAEPRFLPMLTSFEPDTVRGPTVPLFPDRTW
ncbi:MAG: hypothetical protein AB7O66_24050 [Limisphaerales bacterium]